MSRETMNRLLQRYPDCLRSTVARVHASLWADLAKRGIAVGDRDLMTGATAIAKDYAIATRDERSFPKIPGLKVERL
jgi:tRNA(fMet)-specific endonuclease VapC